jgi:hypothetical protein
MSSGSGSGVGIASDALAVAENVVQRKICCAILKVSGNLKTVEVDKTIEGRELNKTNWDSLTSLLNESSPRYIVMNVGFINEDGIEKDAPVFVQWVPDSAKVKVSSSSWARNKRANK